MRHTPIPFVAAAAFLCCGGAARSADWLQFGYDAAHSGSNPDETTLSRENVARLTRWYASILAQPHIDVAPVYLGHADTVAGTVNLLFAVAEDGTLIASNADTGSIIWSKQTYTGDSCEAPPIQSAPAIDIRRGVVYSYGCDGRVHKYAITGGTEILTQSWPQVATLKPWIERGSSALAISADGRHLYSVTGSAGDADDYQGHLTAINLDTGSQVVFNSMCSDLPIHFVAWGQPGVDDCDLRMSGIWGRPGATSDPSTDRVYFTTGNGHFDANMRGFDWGDSVLALNPDGSGAVTGDPVDSYTPTEYDFLETADVDLGSVSLAIVPAPTGSVIPRVGLQTGKDGVLRLIDLDNMNGTGVAGGVGGEISTTPTPTGPTFTNAQPAVWTDTGGDGTIWVFVQSYSGISALKVVLDGANKPALQPTWMHPDFFGSSTPVVANGVLYSGDINCSCIAAMDPHDGAVLWKSPPFQMRHWESPIVVDGSLFVSSAEYMLRFTLDDPPPMHVVTPIASGAGGVLAPATQQNVFDTGTIAFTPSVDESYELLAIEGCGGSFDGRVYTTGSVTEDCTVTATFALAADVIFRNGFEDSTP